MIKWLASGFRDRRFSFADVGSRVPSAGLAGQLPLVFCLVVGLLVSGVSAQEDEEEEPLIDREPFDRITLNGANNFEVLEVKPLRDTARRLNLDEPEKPFEFDQDGSLKFQLPDFGELYWQVPWRDITELKLFEDLLLEDARLQLDGGDYDLCFRTLLYLKDRTSFGDSVEVRQIFEDCLAADGNQAMDDGRFDDALSVYEELYYRNSSYRGRGGKTALQIIAECYDKMIGAEVEAREFLKARNVVEIVRDRYQDRQRDLVDKWMEKIDEEALVALDEVRGIVGQQNGDQAQKAVRNLIHVMPDLDEGHEMFVQVSERFPTVYVGVNQPATDIDPVRIDNWSSRRVGRLTHRWLIEFDGLGDEGGDYVFPQGMIEPVDESGLSYRISIRDDEQPFGVPDVFTYEISNRLIDLADESSPDYYVPWARLRPMIEIENDKSVLFKIRSPYVRPEALIQTSLARTDSERYKVENGKYTTAEFNDQQTVFTLNKDYRAVVGNQHPRIVERVFAGATLADEALIRGEIDVVDRIYPSDYGRLRKDPNIEVRSYGIPTMHMLIPNPRNLHMKSVNFRRGLLYAIDRDLVIDEHVAFGQSISGYQKISGPFPPGSDSTDQIAYGYDNKISTRPHNGKLAIVLTTQVEKLEEKRLENEWKRNNPEVQFDDDGNQIVNEGEEPAKKLPEFKVERPVFVLAHPDNELVENLCRTIASQWQLVGIETKLRKLPLGVTIPPDDDYDVLFMETFMQEPMVDAYQMFGRGGFVNEVDATIKQALWLLDDADSWGDVASSLRRIHQQSYNNLTVLPLWQIIDHYAYRNHVSNLGNRNVHLYQNVERWRIEPKIPEREE